MRKVALLSALAVSVLFAPVVQAADRIYWANYATDKISYANLDGSGGVQHLNTAGATTVAPIGLAIDPVGGRVYWANNTGGKISWANLDGSGGGDLATGSATLSLPMSVSIDVAARRIYWLNEGGNKVSWANLDGSGGADLEIGGASIDLPGALAVLPSAGRVYWTNWGFIGTGWVSYAKLDGTGGATLPITGATLDTPFGMGIDAATGRLYWVNDNPGIVSTANLDGSGASDVDNRGLDIKGAYGLALDPEAGKAWVASVVANKLAFLRLDGTGGATLPFAIEESSGPNFPALMKSPRATVAPSISRSDIFKKTIRKRKKGQKPLRPAPPRVSATRLTCSRGAWAPDLVEAFLYRAPVSTSIEWLRDGSPLPGESSPLLTTTAAGNYSCRETATNWAGAASQDTAVAAFFKVGGATSNRKKGTARLQVHLPPGGALVASGRGVARREVLLSGKRRVTIAPRGRKKARLKAKGRVMVKVKLTFTPGGGPPAVQSVPITLKTQVAKKRSGRR